MSALTRNSSSSSSALRDRDTNRSRDRDYNKSIRHSNNSSSRYRNRSLSPENKSLANDAESNDKSSERILTFDEMGLKEELLKGIYQHGIEKPSAIQQRVIKPILNHRDVIAQSQSGTGKSTLFCIAALQLINHKSKEVQVLILSPTRELAIQSNNIITTFGDYLNAQSLACVGGGSTGENIRALQTQGVQIISGTPGRVLDLIQKHTINCKNIKLLIIDEADEM